MRPPAKAFFVIDSADALGMNKQLAISATADSKIEFLYLKERFGAALALNQFIASSDALG